MKCEGVGVVRVVEGWGKASALVIHTGSSVLVPYTPSRSTLPVQRGSDFLTLARPFFRFRRVAELGEKPTGGRDCEVSTLVSGIWVGG